MESKVVIDTNSIQEFNNNIKTKSNEILDLFIDIEKDLDTIDEKFNSRAGQLYKEKIINYMHEIKKKVDDQNKTLTTKINAIIKVYEDTGKDIEKMVDVDDGNVWESSC